MNPNRPNANPQWQVLTGLTPEAEPKMSPEVRDEKIRILIKEVERRARLEIDRAGHCPDGERTVYWDPTEAACQDLGISRVKLSAYSRRLRGMRAHEIGDKLKAALVKPKIEAWIAEQFDCWWQVFGSKKCAIHQPPDQFEVERELRRDFKDFISFKKSRDAANRFAIKVGFPNITRLRKACVLAFETTLDAIMNRVAYDMVQKCVEQKAAELRERRGAVPAPSAVGKDAANKGEPKLPPIVTPFGVIDEDSPLLKERARVPQITDEEIEQMEKEFEEEMLKDEEAA